LWGKVSFRRSSPKTAQPLPMECLKEADGRMNAPTAPLQEGTLDDIEAEIGQAERMAFPGGALRAR
jgi:hypothetical protein